jgi:hypothetical protein
LQGQIDNSTTSLSAKIRDSIFFPLLENLNGGDCIEANVDLTPGLVIVAWGNPVSLDFPKLSNCSSITAFGMILG